MQTGARYGASMSAKTGSQLLEVSEFLRKVPAGGFLRNLYIRRLLPYSRRQGISITHLLPGQCDARIKDRPRQHNEHHAIHESLLLNLAEHAARLALATALPEGARATLTALSMEYIAPAHGKIRASARCPLPDENSPQECVVLVEVSGEHAGKDGARIATGMVSWLITRESDDGVFES